MLTVLSDTTWSIRWLIVVKSNRNDQKGCSRKRPLGRIRKTFPAVAQKGAAGVCNLTCFHPLTAWPSKERGPSGKRLMVFRRDLAAPAFVDISMKISCGQCSGCRLDRSRQWAIRCTHEASLYENNTFSTLTYRDAQLPNDPEKGQPKNGTLVIRDFQLFMKRLRKKNGAGIRFYACGEYGEKNQRPHYHVCLFNFALNDRRLFKNTNGVNLYSSSALDEIWGNGFTLSGEVTFQSAAYVARYIMKKINGPLADQHYETYDKETGEILSRIPEFTTMSRRPGIGKHWYDHYATDVYPYDEVIVKGKRHKPPVYYDRQYEIADPIGFDAIRKKRLAASKKHSDDRTKERLAAREAIQLAKINKLPRKLEGDEQ